MPTTNIEWVDRILSTAYANNASCFIIESGMTTPALSGHMSSVPAFIWWNFVNKDKGFSAISPTITATWSLTTNGVLERPKQPLANSICTGVKRPCKKFSNDCGGSYPGLDPADLRVAQPEASQVWRPLRIGAYDMRKPVAAAESLVNCRPVSSVETQQAHVYLRSVGWIRVIESIHPLGEVFDEELLLSGRLDSNQKATSLGNFSCERKEISQTSFLAFLFRGLFAQHAQRRQICLPRGAISISLGGAVLVAFQKEIGPLGFIVR
ncbi:uncharacterized protein CLUP02_17078 [Colletotrichum lupini]|uniref:Uncharacterized protein n=1 Tax=Colletotrichum lupini TaxID=145971 RepID=A0A9Q8T9D4_9PEZI|nr:uncharacterized protein CLUP02_17078 [Colletotrichum lupini]UQC91542.1 hypothetical protein CLUP02_17078 [Colletotrichum lupini]